MDINIFRIVILLGVPGLFTYVFFLLMDRFEFKFSVIDSVWSAVIALAFILSVSLLTWRALDRFSKKPESMNKKTDEERAQAEPIDVYRNADRYPEYSDISIPVFDNILNRKSSELFSKLKYARGVLLPHLVAIPITPYSHDSVHHAKQTLSFLTETYLGVLKEELTPEELFVTGVFTQVHDVGMKPHGDYSPKQLYAHHAHKAVEFVDKYLEVPFKEEIKALCLAHNKPLSQAKVHFDGLERKNMRLSLIMSMFRISDMLDVEIQPGPEAMEPAIHDRELMLRIDGKHRGRCIASIDIDADKKEIRVTKEEYVDKSLFIQWLNFFNEKFREYNNTLSYINYSYMIIPIVK